MLTRPNSLKTFQKPSSVAKIVCDPNLEAISADNFQVTVILSGDDELATQTVVSNTQIRTEQKPVGSNGPYDTVELSVGALVNPAFRCQVVDKRGRPIVVLRGANRDTTFSDADKGKILLDITPSETLLIIPNHF